MSGGVVVETAFEYGIGLRYPDGRLRLISTHPTKPDWARDQVTLYNGARNPEDEREYVVIRRPVGDWAPHE